jgi:putative FmdB family regulatory protein
VPTYEYVCSSCKNHSEVVQSFSDAPLATCERCGGQLRRVFHPAGILFKGSGFYSTDNRRAGPQTGRSKPTEKGEKAEKASKAESSTESSTKTAEKSA